MCFLPLRLLMIWMASGWSTAIFLGRCGQQSQ